MKGGTLSVVVPVPRREANVAPAIRASDIRPSTSFARSLRQRITGPAASISSRTSASGPAVALK